MFRWRAKEELLRRGLDDGSPAARGSALLSLELLSRDHPSTVNSVRPLLHKMLADEDENSAVRRLAVLVLKNGSAPRDTIVLLEGLAADDDADDDLRKAAGSVAQGLKRQAPTSASRRSWRTRERESRDHRTGRRASSGGARVRSSRGPPAS
jgi:hypothetical protein